MDAITRSGSSQALTGSCALAPTRTFLLTRSDVERLLTLDECIAAVYRRAAGQQQGVHFPFNA